MSRLRETWRLRLRPRWHEVRPLAIVVAAIGVIVLGVVGFMDAYPEFTFLDALYNSVQLLGFGGDIPTTAVPWQLEVARLLGPLLTGYAAARGVIALSREQLTLLAFRIFLRDHFVIAGLGDVGLRLTLRLYEAGARVVAIERDASTPAIESCRERGISVLVGDASDERLLDKARTGQARLVVAACGDDAVNADVCAAAAGLTQQRARGALTALAHVADPELLSALESWALRARGLVSFRLETFSAGALAIRALLAEHPPFPDGRAPSVLVAGDAEYAEAIVLGAALAWRESGATGQATITLAGPDATRVSARLAASHPSLSSLCELEPLDLAAGDEPRMLARHAGDRSAVYLAFADEGLNLATALSLAQVHRTGDPPIVALVRDEDAGVAAVLASSRGPASAVVPFGVLTRAITPALVTTGRTETLARAMHESYRRAQEGAEETAAGNPALVPWSELPESLRESNRAFASGIGTKLEAAGYVAVPAPLADAGSVDGWLNGGRVEELARLEHERWCEDLHREGWTAGDRRDNERKVHPSLVPYEELSETEREKDREAVRSIPGILAAAGYEMRKVEL